MKRREKFLILTISGIMALALLLTWAPVGAENPPPGESHFMGPAIIANIKFRQATTGDPPFCTITPPADMVFSSPESIGGSKCKGQTFFVPDNFSCCGSYIYDDVTEEDLKGFMFSCDPDLSFIPDDCKPDVDFIDGLMIQAVLSYDDTSTPGVKKAKVIMLFVVPK